MNLLIFPNAEHISQKRTFEYQPKDLDEAKSIIDKIGELLEYSDDYTAVIYAENEEFYKLVNNVPFEFIRDYDALNWRLFFTLKGMLIYEIMDTDDERIIIDPFMPIRDLKKKDIVFSTISNRYFLIINDLDCPNNMFSLFGTAEIYDSNFDYCIPSYYLRKIDAVEESRLGLIKLFYTLYKNYEELDSDEYDEFLYDICEKYKWL